MLLFCSLLAIFSENPVYSIIFLAGCAILLTTFFILFGFEFVGLMFGIVYIGAIIILFLFVVMLLNLDEFFLFTFELIDLLTFFALMLFLTEILSFFFVPLLCDVTLINNGQTNIFYIGRFVLTPLLTFMPLTNPIAPLGILLFDQYANYVLLSGLLLLVILIGVVIILRAHTDRRLSSSKTKANKQRRLINFFIPLTKRIK